MPGDRDWGDCPPKRYRMNDDRRAGCPDRVAPWAACSTSDKYSVWFVGGGAAFAHLPKLLPTKRPTRGRARRSNAAFQAAEGTWGMDYSGPLKKTNVWLQYTRGRKQGGEGAYETDGGPEVLERISGWMHDLAGGDH